MKRIRSFSLRLMSIAIGGLLLLLLTVLFRQTQSLNINQHYQIVGYLRELESTNLVVINDALKNRLSVLHNYDALVADRAHFHYQLTELKQVLSPSVKASRPLQQKLTVLETQELEMHVLMEDFKSEHAILQNSIRYFPKGMNELLGALSADASHPQLEILLSNLLKEVLRYSLNNDPETAGNIEQLLLQGMALPVSRSGVWQTPVNHVFRHAQTILRLQPEVSQAITRLANAPTGMAIEQLALAYEDHHRQITQAKNRYRLWLYVIAMLLMASSLYLAWHHRNAAVLRKVNLNLGHLVADRTQALQQALEQLKQSQTQLIQAEKMSALGQLSAGIAHEINNPISFIHGNVRASEQYSQDCLELLSLYEQHYPSPAEDIQEFIETIDFNFLREDWSKLLNSMKTGTIRVKQIVESLRNFSRLDEADYKAVDLHEGLDSTLLLLNHRLAATANRPTIKIEKTYGELPAVLCNSSAINQVFMNILSNAIEAFDTGHSSPTISITTKTESDYVVLTLADNGDGIPEEMQSKIFDPFFTSKPVGKGTGLGLTVSYQTIVEAHQGLIDVRSVPGEGSAFRIRLPLKGGDIANVLMH